MINADDTGDPGTAASPGTASCLPPGADGGSADPDYADTCPWPSTRYTPGWTQIVAQGDQDDLDGDTALDGLDPGQVPDLGDRRRLQDRRRPLHRHRRGDHRTSWSGCTRRPLPLATIRIQVFNDQTPVDGTYEADAEAGPPWLHRAPQRRPRRREHRLLRQPALHVVPARDCRRGGPSFDADGHPVVDPATNTGKCTSDATGEIVIPNLGPDRYAATVTPPTGDSQLGADHHARRRPGPGHLGPGGRHRLRQRVPQGRRGRARWCSSASPSKKPSTGSAATGEIKGTIVSRSAPTSAAPAGVAYEAGLPGTKVERPDQVPVAGAVRPRRRRRGDLRRPGQRRRRRS